MGAGGVEADGVRDGDGLHEVGADAREVLLAVQVVQIALGAAVVLEVQVLQALAPVPDLAVLAPVQVLGLFFALALELGLGPEA